MKFCKVKINKEIKGNMTKFNYPKIFMDDLEKNKKTPEKCKFYPIEYQNEGLNVEYCICHVADDFTDFDNEEIIEVTEEQASQETENFIDNNINYDPEVAGVSKEEVDLEKSKLKALRRKTLFKNISKK